MTLPVALCAGQFSDLPLEKICSLACEIGYDGLELSFRSSIVDLERASSDRDFCTGILELLSRYNLQVWAISAQLIGKCVGDYEDVRVDLLCPDSCKGKPDEIRKWACSQMMLVPTAAENMGVSVIPGFMGSPLWKYFYRYPQISQDFIDEKWGEFLSLWIPILDEFEKHKIKFALEVHPSEIAYDYYTTQELLSRLDYHPAFGINFDPSHLFWQGIDPVSFLYDFAPHIKNVHIKDVYVKPDGRRGILGSHLQFGDPRRAWNFRSPGHGSVHFDDIIRTLYDIGYHGPLTIEWEDNGMDRFYGARDAYHYIKKLNYFPSSIAFDTTMKYNGQEADV